MCHFLGQMLGCIYTICWYGKFKFLHYYYYYFPLFEFFIPALADRLSLECEWQQVFSTLQDFSQYTGWSQKCSSLDGLHSSFYFQILQSLHQSFGYNQKPQLPSCSTVCSISKQGLGTHPSFPILSDLLRNQPRENVHNPAISLLFFFVVVDYFEVWVSGQD